MLRNLTLLLPALVPSWRFFDVIAPSPRIEYRLLRGPDDPADEWREFRPRPAQVSPLLMIARLFWNPDWNESLFLVSCAERLLDAPTDHSCDEIVRRIGAQLLRDGVDAKHVPYLQFRLVLIGRDGAALTREIAFMSPPQKHDDARIS